MDSFVARPSTGSRAPQGTLLHDFVGDNYVDFFANEDGITDFVIKHIDAFLRCGDIKADYGVLECAECRARRNIPLCCKSRAWCPACMTRRQHARARFFEERVIGDVPVRHLALTLPPPLRVYAAYDPSLVTEILAIHIGANFRRLRWSAKQRLGLASVDEAAPAALTTVQRWSSILDPNLHFHTAATDGVFHRPTPGSRAEFVGLPPPTDDEIDMVAWEICRRTRDLLVRRGIWRDTPEEARDIVLPDASGRPRTLKTVAGILSLDPERPQKCRFFGTVSQHDSDTPLKVDGAYAFNLFARDRVEKGDRKNLRRLLRYMLSPPFTDEQLRAGDDGGMLLDLKRERYDGETSKYFDRTGFMRKLVQLVPRPRANLIRLHGAWGSNSDVRQEAVPLEIEPEKPAPINGEDSPDDYRAWGRLQSHIFDDDIRACRICGGRMKLIVLKVGRFTYRRASGVAPDIPTSHPDSTEDRIAA